jgi:transcriptional regulator with XRE-family HTH domain
MTRGVYTLGVYAIQALCSRECKLVTGVRTIRPVKSIESETEERADAGFGARLAELRKRAGYTSQAKLARKLGLSAMTVHRHESRGILPKPEVLAAYVRELRTSEEYLLYGVESYEVPVAVELYLTGIRGGSVSAEVADRLRRIPWRLLTAGLVDENDVDFIRRMIDTNLKKRGSSVDDQLGGVPDVRRAIPEQQARREHKQRRSRSLT